MNKLKPKHFLKGVLLVIIGTLMFNIALVGGNLNGLVVNANGGKMPVYDRIINKTTDTHFPYYHKAEVNQWFLTDWIKISYISSINLEKGTHTKTISYTSPGDWLIYFGAAGMLFFLVKVGEFSIYILWKRQ